MIYGSLFSGIEAATVAWEPLGWSPAWFAEIAPFPNAVLAHHYPDVPNLGDVNGKSWYPTGWRSGAQVADYHFSDLARIFAAIRGPLDLVCGGSPCQSFSVAGQRLGLSDDRGNLALRFVEICNELSPRWLVWENVPGILISRDNAFGSVLGEMVGADAPLVLPRGNKWPNAGVAAGPERTVAWRVFDAQYFGLAQLRRRVFVIGLRAGERGHPGQVLFEPESLRRHTPPSRETGEEVANALTKGFGSGGPDDNAAQANHLTVARSLTSHHGRQDGDTETFVVEGDSAASTPELPRLRKGCGRGGETAIVVNARQDPDCHHDVSPSMGTKDRGHAVSVALRTREGCATAELGGEVHPALSTGKGGGNKPHVLAWQNRSRGDDGRGYSRGPNVHQDRTGCLETVKPWHVATHSAVRRLMPVECERLQGFPDHYTQIPWSGKPPEECPDGHRYEALGNSMAVPVMRWIGERIQKVETLTKNQAREAV